MDHKFGKWSLEHPSNKSLTSPDRVYFALNKGYCLVNPIYFDDIEPYRRLIASAPDLRELLIAALPALRSMEINDPDLIEIYSSASIVDRVKAALAFIDGVEPENETKL